MDEENVKAISDRPTPKSVSEVRSSHVLVSFYRSFMKDFSTLAALLNEIVKIQLVLNGVMNKNQHLIYLKINYVLHMFYLYLTLQKLLKLNVMHPK